jgi:DMSO/TMAO reductase YedYZ molybdopterin-dependent catalytic subunit
MSRRDALSRMGMVGVGLAVTPVPGWPEAWFVQDAVIPFTDVPADFTGVRPGAEQFPGQNRSAQDLRLLSEWVTPVQDYFVVAHYGIPQVDAASYRLRVGGLARRPLELTLDQIRARPRVTRTTVFECGGNSARLFQGMVGNSEWTGTPLLPLLEDAGWSDDTREVHFWGADSGTEEIGNAQYEQNFARSMSLDAVRERNPIIAYEQNGAPLTIVHGFPVRLIVPGWYGVAQVKWLQRIELSPDRLMTRFMARDYVTLMGRDVDGRTEWVQTSVTRQRLKASLARVTRQGNRFRIFGVAYTDGTPLDRVEVSVDGGAWQRATLDRRGDDYAWTFFTLDIAALPTGDHTLVARATDADGRTQPADLAAKRTRWENNELVTRTIRV